MLWGMKNCTDNHLEKGKAKSGASQFGSDEF